MEKQKAQPNWNKSYIKKAKKEDFIASHTGVFDGINDVELGKIWEKYQEKEEKPKAEAKEEKK